MPHEPPPDDDLPPEGLVAVGTTSTATEAHDEGLVILTCGEPYWVVADSELYTILTLPANAARVQAQLALYREEARRARAPKPMPPRGQRIRMRILALLPLAWIVLFTLRQRHPWIEEAGLADSFRVLGEGEWWRVLTALTLHADVGHLMANVFGWLLFTGFLASSTGAGLATLLAVMAGALGNTANLLMLQEAGHRSLGGSTALFAALGVQTALALFAPGQPTLARRILTPLLASATLLALMGAGESPRTDIGAHVWGFACGLLLGLPLGRPLRSLKVTLSRDLLFASSALLLLAMAWRQALA